MAPFPWRNGSGAVIGRWWDRRRFPSKWLAVDGLLSQFGAEREEARQHYQHFVSDGVGQGIWEGLRQQIYLGGEAFVERMQAKVKIDGDALTVPQAQRRPPAPSLADIAAHVIAGEMALL